MKRTPVSSSIIESVGYDPDSQVLEIEFKEGGVYRYTGVPESVYNGLMSVDSHGTYHAEHVKHSYPFERVK
ncbi:KTSC domain-containing protein [Halobacteriaceae archaeon GCM10025711]